MKNLILPLVNWAMGAIIIGVFAIVCVVMVVVIYHLAKSDKKKNDRTQPEA